MQRLHNDRAGALKESCGKVGLTGKSLYPLQKNTEAMSSRKKR